jgi:hypothetical protein
VEADIGTPVGLEVVSAGHLLHERGERLELLPGGSLGGEDRGAGLDRHAVVEHGPGRLAERLSLAFGQRRALGDERAAAPSAQRNQVTALHECRQRLA